MKNKTLVILAGMLAILASAPLIGRYLSQLELSDTFDFERDPEEDFDE